MAGRLFEKLLEQVARNAKRRGELPPMTPDMRQQPLYGGNNDPVPMPMEQFDQLSPKQRKRLRDVEK